MKLRTVNKVEPPYLLNHFPKDFGLKLGKEIIYNLATKPKPSIEGEEWESIFARCVGAEWKPSNVGLDDVVLEQCAWNAKSVKNKYPSTAKTVRLISGRNSTYYSFGQEINASTNPALIGEQVLGIWNERVSSIRKIHKFLRTVVLIKSDDLQEVCVFEFDTIRYEHSEFVWQWNENNNLMGLQKENHFHRFTWQPHGSQFTIVEEVPDDCLIIQVRCPNKVSLPETLKVIGYSDDWVSVFQKRDLPRKGTKS